MEKFSGKILDLVEKKISEKMAEKFENNFGKMDEKFETSFKDLSRAI